MQEARNPPCLLLVLDLNPFFWGCRTTTNLQKTDKNQVVDDEGLSSAAEPPAAPTVSEESEIGLAKFLSVLTVFLNAYRLMHKDAGIRIIASHLEGATLLVDNTHPGKLSVELRKKLRFLAKNSHHSFTEDSAPAELGSKLGAALSLSLCIANKLIREDITPRILVFMASPDVSKQYISVMNCIFSAQKLKILIDSCILYREDSSLLQQAAYITGGVYLRPAMQEDALIEYLLCAFLPDGDTRQYLKVPLLQKVDFRASCFCHKQPRDVAFVCSVCLSIFCTFVPVCPTCRVKFPFVL